MWYDRVKFRVNFVSLIFLSNNVFVTRAIDCHENDAQKINQKLLERTNYYRGFHNVGPLTMDNWLIENSTEWAKHLAEKGVQDMSRYGHTYGRNYGENVGHLTGVPYDDSGMGIIELWYEERENYHYYSEYSENIANFTQLVWKDTKNVGCGICSSDETNHYIVCRYLSAGNILRCNPRYHCPDIMDDFHVNVFQNEEEPAKYPSTNDSSEEENAAEIAGTAADTCESLGLPNPQNLIKTLLAAIIYMMLAISVIPIVILLIMIYHRFRRR